MAWSFKSFRYSSTPRVDLSVTAESRFRGSRLLINSPGPGCGRLQRSAKDAPAGILQYNGLLFPIPRGNRSAQVNISGAAAVFFPRPHPECLKYSRGSNGSSVPSAVGRRPDWGNPRHLCPPRFPAPLSSRISNEGHGTICIRTAPRRSLRAQLRQIPLPRR